MEIAFLNSVVFSYKLVKKGFGPQLFPTLVTALPHQSTYITLNGDIYTQFLIYRICRYDDKGETMTDNNNSLNHDFHA